MTEFIPQNKTGEVILVRPKRFEDNRGYFTEAYQEERFFRNGIGCRFVQDNHSYSNAKGIVRGLHFQTPPFEQNKLVRCVRGRILDYAVDIRYGSPGFGECVSVELSAANGYQLFIPVGFAHAFCTLEPDCEVYYKVSAKYAPDCDFGLAYNDPELNIQYPFPPEDLTLSEKDLKHPRLKDLPKFFKYSD